MPAGSLLTLLDDIASVLEDVSILTKKAAVKTSGVLGDDLALNAEQVSGVNPERELPVVWAVAKGSFINKLILVPLALTISQLAPWAVTPLLMVGGLYLCFEGCEKILHPLIHRNHTPDCPLPPSEPESETDKIKGAIRTDFVLSAEIITISLGVVQGYDLSQKAITLSAIAVIMTIGVYGLVASIVKLDDLGLYLSQRPHALPRTIGATILWLAPFLMKLLSIVGTAAMFLVGGGILTHGIPPIHHWIEHTSHQALSIPNIGSFISSLTPSAVNGTFGFASGTVALLAMLILQKCRKPRHPSH